MLQFINLQRSSLGVILCVDLFYHLTHNGEVFWAGRNDKRVGGMIHREGDTLTAGTGWSRPRDAWPVQTLFYQGTQHGRRSLRINVLKRDDRQLTCFSRGLQVHLCNQLANQQDVFFAGSDNERIGQTIRLDIDSFLRLSRLPRREHIALPCTKHIVNHAGNLRGVIVVER